MSNEKNDACSIESNDGLRLLSEYSFEKGLSQFDLIELIRKNGIKLQQEGCSCCNPEKKHYEVFVDPKDVDALLANFKRENPFDWTEEEFMHLLKDNVVCTGNVEGQCPRLFNAMKKFFSNIRVGAYFDENPNPQFVWDDDVRISYLSRAQLKEKLTKIIRRSGCDISPRKGFISDVIRSLDFYLLHIDSNELNTAVAS